VSADATRRVEVYPDREVVVEFDPDLTFECVDDCTWCCHHGVLLYDRDLLELAQRANLAETTTEFRGEKFVTREAKDRDDHVAEDGHACAFCGRTASARYTSRKTGNPLGVRSSRWASGSRDGDLHVDIRDSAHEHCEGLNVSDRSVIDNLEAFLPEVLWDLENPDSDRELCSRSADRDRSSG